MKQDEWLEVKEVELLRLALTQAETLCATLDRAEFIEPMDFDADLDASRARKGITKRLELREAALLRKIENQNSRRKSFVA